MEKELRRLLKDVKNEFAQEFGDKDWKAFAERTETCNGTVTLIAERFGRAIVDAYERPRYVWDRIEKPNVNLCSQCHKPFVDRPLSFWEIIFGKNKYRHSMCKDCI